VPFTRFKKQGVIYSACDRFWHGHVFGIETLATIEEMIF